MHRTRRKLSLIHAPIVFVLVTSVALLTGCGSSEKQTMLQGNAAVRSVAISADQSLTSGITYPFVGLQVISPTGSALSAVGSPLGRAVLTRSSPFLGALAGVKAKPGRAGGTTYLPILDLYYTPITTSGNIATMNYFKDAAGTQSAGSLKMTIQGASTFSTDFTAYPVTCTIDVKLTAGILPANGSVTVTFTGATGKNTLHGSMNLTKNNIPFVFDLTLSDSLDVTGTVDITEGGSVVHLTNIHGNLVDPLQCDISMSPLGWTGSGTFSLLTGSYTMNLNTGSGTATASTNSNGDLTLSFADTTQQTVTHPLNSSLDGTGGSGGSGGGGGGGSSAYKAPVAVANTVLINGIGPNGEMVGGSTSGGASYWASASAQPVRLPGVSTNSGALAISTNGVIIGFESFTHNNLTLNRGYVWTSSTAQPQLLQPLPNDVAAVPVSINADGQIVGRSTDNTGLNRGVYWASATGQPQLLTPLAGDDSGIATAINDNGVIIGLSHRNIQFNPPIAGRDTAVVWTSPTAQPQTLAFLSGDTKAAPNAINNAGQIVGTSFGATNRGVYWASPTAQPQVLPTLSGDDSVHPFDINNSGVITGESLGPQSRYHAVIWKSLQLTDLNTQIPSGTGWTLERSFLINDQGVIQGTGLQTGSTNSKTFVIAP